MVLDKILKICFVKSPESRKIALELLIEVKKRQDTDNPYTSTDMHEFCRKHGFSEGKYSDMLSVLVSRGLIHREKGTRIFRIDYTFIHQLEDEFMDFLKS